MKIFKLPKAAFILAVSISFLTYIAFFGHFLTPSYYFFGEEGNITDPQTGFVPARFYFYEKVAKEHSFPFWTEKIFSGFPIYADPENAYLNPLNGASIILFGPNLSYKILHLFEYFLGSLSLYFLLRRKGVGLLGYAATNVIFYFNTFFINHQIHFNMIMSLYLIPTAFLLSDLFIETRKLRYIILQSFVIANAVLWGHLQSALILSLGIFIYMLVYSFRKMRLSTFFFYLAALSALVIIETLPQLLPSYEMFAQSSRKSDLDYLKGSFNSRMAIFLFVPYLFGTYHDFFGLKINDGFAYTDIYIYAGISSCVLAFLALLFLKKSRETILAFLLIWIFLLFGFMSSNKLFPDETPLINIFRQWGRTAVLSNFGIALLAGIFLHNLKNVSWRNMKKLNLFMTLSPVAYILFLVITHAGKNNKKVGFYTSFEYIQSYPFFPALKMFVIALVCTLLFFFVVKKLFPKFSVKIIFPVGIILVAIIFFDLLHFNKDVLNLRLQDISYYKIGSAPSDLEKKRSILNSMQILGMESLYYSNWSPLGRSQLKEKPYVDHCHYALGIDLRGMPSSARQLPENLKPLKDSGIVAIAKKDEIVYLNNNELDLIKNEIGGYYAKKSEGHIIMHVSSSEDVLLETYLRYNPYWRVKVDGEKTEIIQNGIFFNFPLKKGEHKIEIYYFPKIFYITVIISMTLIIVLLLIYWVLRKRYYHNLKTFLK